MMRKVTLSTFLSATLVIGALAVPIAAQNRLVNMVPNNRSGETNQDAEPTITVDPNNYNRIVGSAFTWDNLTGGPNLTNTAPVFVSTDRGATWTLAFIVPSLAGAGFPTGDINISFSSTPSGAVNGTSWLYGGILSSTGSPRPMLVLRAQDPFSAAVMTQLSNRPGNVDQPHAKALTSFWDGQDRVYVGFNNGWGCVILGGRTATLDVTQDGKVAVPTMTLDLIEARNNACQNGFAQVPAPHLDGTVYAAFIHDWCSSCGTPRMTVVRDDNWGQAGSPFTTLTDPSDLIAGRFIAPAMTLASGFMGQNRLGASNVSIAVDPRDSDRVYVAWGDNGGASIQTIHVRRSIDRGVNWSGADLLNVTSAMNPQIAINSMGTVGVLYQRVVANRWETHFVNTTDPDATVFNTPGLLLANQSATTPIGTFSPYIGDYASLVSAGKNFIGMFSASNLPDTANFLPGVQFQREVNWGTHQLFTDATHTTVVNPSIDPFFFEIETVSSANDFYVRDWTDDATHGDNGVEPSTHSNFYSFSDVWNRHSAAPGPFVSDQPSNEDALNLPGTTGDNWAFARVRRNVGGPVTAVTAHFLVSRFGTGGNFEDATTGDLNLSFPDPDPVITTDGSAGPWITVPYHWRLNTTAGNHLCLAVQISTPGDPYIPPTLEGNTPGWSTGTDLRIINDNNKAQRNMHLTTIPASGGGGSVTEWAIVHNPGFLKRDIPLRIDIRGISQRYLRDVTVQAIGGERPVTLKAQDGSGFVLRDVQPGENRWVAINVQTVGLPTDTMAFVGVDELAGDKVASGFGVGVRSASLRKAIEDSLIAQRVELTRLESGFAPENIGRDDEYFKTAALSPSNFVDFVQGSLLPRLKNGLEKVGAPVAGDPFNLRASFTSVEKEKSAPAIVTTLASLLNGIDAQLTQLQLQNGDPADIVQMVRWQKHLYQRQPNLAKLSCANDLIATSTEFLHGRESGKLTNAAYPRLLSEVSKCLVQGIKEQGGKLSDLPSFESNDLATLQKRHRAHLLALVR
jgi:hypothetical protein